MEICHKMGINVDDVTDGLKLAKQRLISPAYLTAGMADGGGCHPRDNIALSWLARKLDLSFDFFDAIMMQRELGTDWLADIVTKEAHAIQDGDHLTKIYILGKAFKAETNLTVGSPSVLLKNILHERAEDVEMYDPHVDEETPEFKTGVYFIGTKHEEFQNFDFPDGSTVIDPWRYLKNVKFDSGLVKYIPLGG
jgi:UDPglucose 6-dehydrogenase